MVVEEFGAMSSEGTISKSFVSVRLQLLTLFEEAGGERALSLLDKLAALPARERDRLLDLFLRAADDIQEAVTPKVEGSAALTPFEEGLYKDLVAAIETNSESAPRPQLALVNGRRDNMVSFPQRRK